MPIVMPGAGEYAFGNGSDRRRRSTGKVRFELSEPQIDDFPDIVKMNVQHVAS